MSETWLNKVNWSEDGLGSCHRSRCGKRACADGGVDESRGTEANLAKERGDILVAFAQEAVAQGRRVRPYPKGDKRFVLIVMVT